MKVAFGGEWELVLDTPEVVIYYNAHMGWCDVADQLRSYFTPLYRSLRTWMPVMIMLLEVAMINAFQVWSRLREQGHADTLANLDHKHFRLAVINQVFDAADDNTRTRLQALKRRRTNKSGSPAPRSGRRGGYLSHAALPPVHDISEPHLPLVQDAAKTCQLCAYNSSRKRAELGNEITDADRRALKQVPRTKMQCSNPNCAGFFCCNGTRNCFLKAHTDPKYC